MKKVLFIFLSIILVISGCGCNSGENNNETTYFPTQAETYVITDCEVPDSRYSLDILMENDLNSCQSNYEYSETYGKYADEWKKLMNEYYETLLAHHYPLWHDYDISEVIKEQQKRWEEYAEAELEFIKDYNTCLFQSGSGAGPANAQRTCNLYKDRALELYSYCKDFHLECTEP